MRILLTGGSGQIGWELRRTLATLGDVVAPPRTTLDLASGQSIGRVVREIRPQLVVNAAGYTAVDRAEEEIDSATQINANAPGILAGECKRIGAVLIHYSTDYVFDGRKSVPYTEQDDPSPLSVYGQSKLLGETLVQDESDAYLIFRTSWIYGMRGKNFLLTMRRLAEERQTLNIVNDQLGSPTWSRMVAEATAQIIAKGISGQGFERAWFEQQSGLYHMSATGSATWYAFAKAIFEQLGLPVTVSPIASSAYPVAAQRPPNSCLDNSKLGTTFGIQLPDWRTGLVLSVGDESKRAECIE